MGALKGAAHEAGRAARRAQVGHLRQRGLHRHRCRRRCNDPVASMPRLNNPDSRGGASAPARPTRRANVLRLGRTCCRHARRVRRRQPRTTRRSTPSIRAGLAVFEYDIDEGVTHHAGPTGRTCTDAGHAARAGRQHRRPRHRQPQRSRDRDEADHPRLERLLPVGYNSTQAPTDGKFHEIKVRVKRRGVEVRARQGILGLHRRGCRASERRRRSRSAVPTAVSTALNDLASSRRAADRRTSGSAPPQGENGKTAVTFAWEPMPRDVPARIATGSAASRVALTAMAPDGRRSIAGVVPEAVIGPDAPASPWHGGPSAALRSMSPPGKLQLQDDRRGDAAAR